MPRATRVVSVADRQALAVVDTLILPFAQRQAQKGFLFGTKGICVELDLPEPVRLRTDDALVLDDGTLVEVVAEPEPLIEARAADLAALARLAWHLGDRHVPVQVLERRLRLRRDPAIEAMLEGLGARLVAIDAPFEPEGGAYAAPDGAHHHHEHDHHHHDHHHHDHHHDDRGHDHDHDHRHAHDHHHDHDHKRN
jgi:urease accessory protein